MLSLLHHCFVSQILDAQRRLKGNLDEGIAVTERVTALLATKDQLPQLGTDAVRLSTIYSQSGVLYFSLAPPSLPPSLSGVHGMETDQDR